MEGGIVHLDHVGTRAQDGLEAERAAHTLVLRGWTGEFLQAHEVGDGDYRLWHPDGSYFGRLIPDAEHSAGVASGTVFGPTGLYLADAVRGRLRIDPSRRRVRGSADGYDETAFASPGDLAPVERRWPRRG
jgi:hypothetical protein